MRSIGLLTAVLALSTACGAYAQTLDEQMQRNQLQGSSAATPSAQPVTPAAAAAPTAMVATPANCTPTIVASAGTANARSAPTAKLMSALLMTFLAKGLMRSRCLLLKFFALVLS